VVFPIPYLLSGTYDEIEKAEHRKKKLDRIVQKAEAAQRFKKLGGWK